MTTTPPPPPPTIWVLTDDVTGHANQSLGVAEALGLSFVTRELRYGPWALLPGALGPRCLLGLSAASRAALVPPWPGMVIATGRRLGAVARWIKRQAGQAGLTTRIVQIMDPLRGRDEFDLIAAPRHDRTKPRDNLIETIGAPNRITPARLMVEAEAWRDRFSSLSAPRIAVLVGGATQRRGFAPALAAELGRLASRLAESCHGSLLITTSRRTGGTATDALAQAVTVPRYIHRWGTGGGAQDNPYFALLASADAIVVTGESMSMCSEACATGKPVYIYAPPAIVKPGFARLHQALYSAGMAKPLSAETSLTFDSNVMIPLSAARDIAAEIRRRFAL